MLPPQAFHLTGLCLQLPTSPMCFISIYIYASVFVCVMCMRLCAHSPVHVCRSQTVFGVFLYSSSPEFLRWGPLSKPRVHQLARLAGQQSLGSCLTLLPPHPAITRLIDTHRHACAGSTQALMLAWQALYLLTLPLPCLLHMTVWPPCQWNEEHVRSQACCVKPMSFSL